MLLAGVAVRVDGLDVERKPAGGDNHATGAVLGDRRWRQCGGRGRPATYSSILVPYACGVSLMTVCSGTRTYGSSSSG